MIGRKRGPTKFEPTEDDKRLADSLRERRHAMNLSQAELANRVGLSLRTIYRIEKYQRGVRQQDMRLIQAALGGSVGAAPVGSAATVLRAYFALPPDEAAKVLAVLLGDRVGGGK